MLSKEIELRSMRPIITARTCPYCGRKTVKVNGLELYGKYEHKDTTLYACKPCGAWVTCHKDTGEPMGSLADKELRDLRHQAHAHFDTIWMQNIIRHLKPGKQKRRIRAYAWLQEQLGIAPELCHISRMGPLLCKETIKLSKNTVTKFNYG